MEQYCLLLCVLNSVCAQAMSGRIEPGLHVRSSLARNLLMKYQQDQRHSKSEHTYWYTVDTSSLSPSLCDAFLQCDQDEGTCTFLSNCFEKTDWVFTQLYHSIMKSILSWFMTQTTINGYLSRGSMFVFSSQQFQQLLGVDSRWHADTLLDLGAGDGKVSQQMAAHFNEVYTTETSVTMQWRLQEKGFKNLEIDKWANGDHIYDVISCLNLLDRCAEPMTLLKDIRRVLRPDTGRLVVALVTPFKPYVEFGGGPDNKPKEQLNVTGKTFEDQVTSLVQEVFTPAGFELVRFTRLPYLCEGDLEQSFYVLNDAVFVLKPS